MEFIRSIFSYLSPEYLALHPDFALIIAFAAAFAEALLVIGLFVPSTVILMGAGTLVGAGHLDFWPVFLATAVGCILGDQISYWAGRWYGDRLKSMWPLSRYPQLLEKGEAYVRKHGGKSIAIGRFVPGVKAVVPGIVGMLRMNQMYFLTVNITSGIAWAAIHILPGILIGKSLAVAGQMSERLLVVLLVLLVVLALAGWLVRVLVGSLSPYIDRFLWWLSGLASQRSSRPLRRLGQALRPDKSRAKLLLLFGFVCFGAVLMLADLVSGLMLKQAFSNVDLTVQNLMLQLRSEPGDDLMIPVTMFGDTSVATVIAAACVAWLLWRKALRQAVGAASVFAIAQFTVHVLKSFIGRPRPSTGAVLQAIGSFSFPSSHAVLAGTSFGLVAVIASHGLQRWSKALVVSVCSGAAIAVAFSRVYLGMHWLSDVMGGLLIALTLISAYVILLEAFPIRRLRPFGFMASMSAVILGFGGYHIYHSLDRETAFYAAPAKTTEYALADWTLAKWSSLPLQRIDLAGTPEEAFSAQWVGSLDVLTKFAVQQGWTSVAPWRWTDGLHYLDDKAAFSTLLPRPLLHEGLPAKFTAIVSQSAAGDSRVVLRAFQSIAVVKLNATAEPVFLISLTEEKRRSTPHLFAIPMRATAAEQGALPDVFAGIETKIPGTIVTRQQGLQIIVAGPAK
jgi:membrane protein DedA with SNARE-associated domain/membrane-associated phospholipid phosphatase